MRRRGQRRSPALIATAIALPVAVLVGFLVFAVLAQKKHSDGQHLLRDVAAPSASDAACGSLIAAMPQKLGEFTRDSTTGPAGYARWQSTDSGTVELRCGVERPARLTRTSSLQMVDTTQWLSVAPSESSQSGLGSYWFAVDHRPYVQMWIPDNSGTAAIQAASDAVNHTLKPASLDFG
ncbi:DUF3515 domain-containing protein [Tsukamurella sp. 8F]|uniref:DUF3515 domain-containing protein n=1 Tax=Tsukamurella sp. 8F TaxID=3031961 RepID=UPI0023B8F003|nr:DUF3515 domain-containing protein [Tsukamurella sp. 8F]MDF0586133.1 DUF3515 domain-containing protein [Tsukamurella sp. 8F]